MADQSERPDPFEALGPADLGPTRPPLPAAEVRAAGDRMRRRRTAWRTVAAAAAVAVVSTGGVAIGGGLPSTAPPPMPATQGPSPQVSETERPSPGPTPGRSEIADPEYSWTTTIPEDFPLALGYPEARFEETRRVGPERGYQPIDHISACGRIGFPTEEWADLLGASFTQPEDTRHRMLTTYPDAETARAAVAGLVDTYRACPRDTADPGWAYVTQLREVDPGDEGYVAIQTAELDGAPAPGVGLTYVVRVGNAVLLHATSNEGGGNEQQINAQLREQTPLVTELAGEMCIFALGGCERYNQLEDAQEQAREQAMEATREAEVFGPEGVAGVELGMPFDAAPVVAMARLPGEDGPCTVLHRQDGERADGDPVDALVTEEQGVVALFARPGARTPEGVTFDTTLEEVRAAYPRGRWLDPVYVTPVPGFEDRQYAFTFAGGESTGLLSMELRLRDRPCG